LCVVGFQGRGDGLGRGRDAWIDGEGGAHGGSGVSGLQGV
jgi:hypothetical protein